MLEYDDVANDQRRVIYQQRTDLMSAEDVAEAVKGIREDVVTQLVDQYVPGGTPEEQWDAPGLAQAIEKDFGPELPIAEWLKAEEAGDGSGLRNKIIGALEQVYDLKQTTVGTEVMRYIEKEVMLRTLDQHWREHLAAMDYMRQGIFLRSYAQKNPKQEYKREAFELFSAMLDRIKFDTVTTVSKIQVRSQAEIEREELERQQRLARALRAQHAEAISPIQAPSASDGGGEPPSSGGNVMELEPRPNMPPAAPFVRQVPKVGRNEPCPCGSGRKYKHCHGALHSERLSPENPRAAVHVVAAALIDAAGRVLIAQRPMDRHMAGGWEFPGGKLEPGEDRLAGLARELQEELGISIATPRPLIRVRHAYPSREVLLDVWVVRRYQGEPRGLDGQALRWCTQDELAEAQLLPADGPIVKVLWLPERLTQASTPDYVVRDSGSMRDDTRLKGAFCACAAQGAVAAAAGADFLALRVPIAVEELETLCRSVSVPVYARKIALESAWAVGASGVNEIDA